MPGHTEQQAPTPQERHQWTDFRQEYFTLVRLMLVDEHYHELIKKGILAFKSSRVDVEMRAISEKPLLFASLLHSLNRQIGWKLNSNSNEEINLLEIFKANVQDDVFVKAITNNYIHNAQSGIL